MRAPRGGVVVAQVVPTFFVGRPEAFSRSCCHCERNVPAAYPEIAISVGMRGRRIPPSVCAQCLRILRVTPKTLRLPAVSSRLPDSRTRDLPFAFTGAPPFVSKGGSDSVAQVSRRLRTRDLGFFGPRAVIPSAGFRREGSAFAFNVAPSFSSAFLLVTHS